MHTDHADIEILIRPQRINDRLQQAGIGAGTGDYADSHLNAGCTDRSGYG